MFSKILQLLMFLISISCDFTIAANNELINYSQPIKYIHLDKMNVDVRYRRANTDGSRFFTSNNKYWIFSENGFQFTATNKEIVVDSSYNRLEDIWKYVKMDIHIMYEITLSYDYPLDFRNIDSLGLVFNISGYASNPRYEKEPLITTYSYKKIEVKRVGETEYSFFYNPEKAIEKMRNDPDQYYIRYVFGLNSGVSPYINQVPPEYVFEPNRMTYNTDLQLYGFYK